jgi:hypothetical protein
VQRHVAERIGHGFDFFAYLEDRLGDERVDPAALPFAQFARSLADRFRAPGAMPGAAAGRGRSVEEPIFAVGLTVRAARRLSTPARQLRWSADGRLAVVHEVGIDVFGAPRACRCSRANANGRRIVSSGSCTRTTAPRSSRCSRRSKARPERQSREPFRFEVVPFERQRLVARC